MNVEGVALDKVDQKLVASSAKKFAVATKGKTLGTVVRELAAKLRDGDGDMDACTECGGPWPEELDACPFCGDLANAEEEAKGDPAGVGGDGADDRPAGSSRSDSEASSSVAPSEVESSTALARMSDLPLRSMLAGAGAPVVVAQTEVQLDKLVAAVNAAKEQGAKNFWMVVTLLKRCIDTNLWKQRVDEKGNPAYRSAWEFATKELEFSRTYAQRLYRTASEFSEKTIDQLGVNRLVLVLAAPEASREKLLEEARAGASRSKLAGMTRGLLDEQRAKEGKARPGAKSKVAPVALAPVPAPAKVLAPPKKEEAGELTLALMPGKKHKVWLYGPTKEKDGKFKPAKRLADEPHGWLDLPNGVRIVVQGPLVAPTGQLYMVVKATREGA